MMAEKTKALDTAGYVGFANLPNQVHRKSVKKGFEFTLMVVGESGLGKSTLINSLFLTELYPDRAIPSAGEKVKRTVKLDASTVEIEERGVKLRLTVVDTPGFGDAIDNTDSFHQIIRYIDDQFERYLQDENGLNRKNIIDNRVHCCFYFINPYGHGLKPLDIDVMKQLSNKVSIVPVIAKSDCLTKKEISALKQKVLQEIQENDIKIYSLPECDSDEDEDYKAQVQGLRDSIPFAVVGAKYSSPNMRQEGSWATVPMGCSGKLSLSKSSQRGVVLHLTLEMELLGLLHLLEMAAMLEEVYWMKRIKKLMEKEAELKRMQELMAAMQQQIKQQSQTSLQTLTFIYCGHYYYYYFCTKFQDLAGSNGWHNYRHQSDICHAYQIVRNHGTHSDNIIVMMYDDIAFNKLNPTPGVLINKPHGPNVYEGIKADYTRKNVRPDIFIKVLEGTNPGALIVTEAGSMFANILPKYVNVYAMTATNSKRPSYACYYSEELKTYLGDVFSVNWMEDSDVENLHQESIKRQFHIVKNETVQSFSVWEQVYISYFIGRNSRG
ncbi:SEPT2 [Lepeophtheirus salmonis]|uniref:SEPT2 n=1 Tax=Lepeophtheirus salmonis TaxID=72036 RepID=A0A7R8CDE3_LEPSM|nr:SEPT2 [Lepeophtheirus salmonis]CAF2778601.1 SEPT2 [Lepeophtheirus salmonis]